MSIRAYEGVSPEWYTPESEKDKDDAAEFEIRPLTGPELLEVQIYFNAEKVTIDGPGLVLACRYGLIGWKNILGEDGKDTRFTRLGYNKLPGEIIAELAGRVINMSSLGEEDAKN